MLRTVNYCKMLSDDNPIKTMFVRVFKCFLLFVSFLIVPGICRIRCLLSYASSEKTLWVLNWFVVQDAQNRSNSFQRINRPPPDFILTRIAIQAHADKFHYLEQIKNLKHRRAVAKLRSGNLRIEPGRHCVPKLPECLRICQHCHSNQIENEKSFLISLWSL